MVEHIGTTAPLISSQVFPNSSASMTMIPLGPRT